MALYLLKPISPQQSQKHAADAACVTPWGRQPPKIPVPTLLKDQFPFPTSPPSWSHVQARDKKQTTSSSCNGLSLLPSGRGAGAFLSAQGSPPGWHEGTADRGPRLDYLLSLVTLLEGRQPWSPSVSEHKKGYRCTALTTRRFTSKPFIGRLQRKAHFYFF